jgi:MHS family proline/betaine transporter-like MFS transporter
MIMMSGLFLAVILYRPIYKQMFAAADLTKQQEVVVRKHIDKSSATTLEGDSLITVTTTRYFNDDNHLVVTDTRRLDATGQESLESSKSIVLGTRGFWIMTSLVLIQLVLVTMVYGPIAAFLVELFPTRIRYTSMSLPYHIGNGIFGGLTPFLATALYESSKSPENPAGDVFSGLWYPIVVAAISFIVGMIWLKDRKVADVNE